MNKGKIIRGVVSCLMALTLLGTACTSAANKDTTAPKVNSTINANGAKNVPVNTKVGAFFSEAMKSSTFTTTTFTLKQGNTPVTGKVAGVGVAATFTPAVNLAPNTEYTATITTGAKDLAGNALASAYTWKWTTGATPDTTAPKVSLTINANGATNVPVNAKVGMFFAEAMDPLTITTTTFTLKRGTTPVTGTVSYIGLAALFTPAADLAPNTEYTVTLTTGAKDMAGNALASPYILKWTTAPASGTVAPKDTTAPTVTSTINADGATNVPINAKAGAFFSEAMDPLTITTTTFTLKQGSTPVLGTVTYVGLAATFTPDANLSPNTQYTATITTGAKDLAGNALAVAKVLSWTTAATADTTVPAVSSTIPANGSTGAVVTSAISATFSEAMDPSTVTTATFTVAYGTTPASGVVIYLDLTATFDPDGQLAPGVVYTATLTRGAMDLAGNALAADYVWTFIPGEVSGGGGGGGGGGGDTTAPTVTINQASGQADPTGTSPINFTAVFSESVADFATGDVAISGTAGGVKTATVTGSGTTYNVAVTGMTTGGTVIADIAAGNAHDAASNPSTASTSTDKTVTYTTPGLTVTINQASGQVDPTSTSPINFTVVFSASVADFATGDVTVNGTAGGTKTANVTGSGTTYNVAVTGMTTAGTVIATIAAGKAQDASSNLNAASTSTDNTVTYTVTLPANPTAPNLGESGRFVILASQTITTTGATAITGGDIAILDQARSYMTTGGFTPTGPAGDFTQLTGGTSFAGDDVNPAPFPYPLKYATPVVGAPWATTSAMITQSRTDMGVAYTFLKATNPTAPNQACPTELGTLTLTRGVYKTAANVLLTTGALHLDAQGDPNSVFIFVIGGTLTIGAPSGEIILDGLAQAKNVYFVTDGLTTIQAGRIVRGNIFATSQVNVLAGASIIGRLWGQTGQVTLIGNTVTKGP